MASYTSTVPATHRLHPGYAHPLLKTWQNECAPVAPQDLVYPIFITEQADEKQPIAALPDQYRWGVNRLTELLEPLVEQGLTSVLLFGVITDAAKKTPTGDYCINPNAPVPQALKLIRTRYPSLLCIVDICLCAYTDHGHCGICKPDGTIDNQPSIDRLAEMSVFYAQCGAQVIAPSDMMDGRIGAIKAALVKAGLDGVVSVMSYAAKFASCFYGPFRDAAASGMQFGDRSCYQLPPGGRGLSLRAVDRDLQEGADMVMVKPGGPYLDIVRDVKNRCQVPVAIYHVSGEYAMLYWAAQHGAFTLSTAVLETLLGFKRAGANILITYFTPFLLNYWHQQKQQSKQ